MRAPFVAQPADHQRLKWINNATLTILLDHATTDGQPMVGRFQHVQDDATPLHLHRHEDEMFLLLAGTATVWCDGVRTELQEGGVVFLPRDVPHAYRITSPHADLLMFNAPAGVEGMFRAVGQDLSEPGAADATVKPDEEIAERYGNVILGPPPDATDPKR